MLVTLRLHSSALLRSLVVLLELLITRLLHHVALRFGLITRQFSVSSLFCLHPLRWLLIPLIAHGVWNDTALRWSRAAAKTSAVYLRRSSDVFGAHRLSKRDLRRTAVVRRVEVAAIHGSLLMELLLRGQRADVLLVHGSHFIRTRLVVHTAAAAVVAHAVVSDAVVLHVVHNDVALIHVSHAR